MIYKPLTRNLKTHKGSRIGQGKELSEDVILWESVASARSHRELCSMSDITRLSYFEFKGTELLPPTFPIFSCWQSSTQISARSRNMGKTPANSTTPPKLLALTSLFSEVVSRQAEPKTLTLVKSWMAPNSLRTIISPSTKSYDSLEA